MEGALATSKSGRAVLTLIQWNLVQLCHCVEQHLQQEGGQGAPCLPYGIQSLETWGLMLAGKATKDAACDHAFAKALCHLLAAAERLDNTKDLDEDNFIHDA